MRKIVAAAQAGQSLLDLQVYDGSETGEKIYNTLTVIGQPIAPGAKPPADAGAKEPALLKLRRWPVIFPSRRRGKSQIAWSTAKCAPASAAR